MLSGMSKFKEGDRVRVINPQNKVGFIKDCVDKGVGVIAAFKHSVQETYRVTWGSGYDNSYLMFAKELEFAEEGSFKVGDKVRVDTSNTGIAQHWKAMGVSSANYELDKALEGEKAEDFKLRSVEFTTVKHHRQIDKYELCPKAKHPAYTESTFVRLNPFPLPSNPLPSKEPAGLRVTSTALILMYQNEDELFDT
jgi:hypothetical protein